tara:strand:- start:392 stop:1723 length:1332 start_codon:yes stop_codon:yes gene_type:complete
MKLKKGLIEILVIKIFYFFLFFTILTSCSFNKNSKFWTSTTPIKLEKDFNEIFLKEKKLQNELNPNLKIQFNYKTNNDTFLSKQLNNDGIVNFDNIIKKSSRYNFSKIKNFHQYEPEISFYKKNLIFFDNKGSILQFNQNSKLNWKKNYYSKSEKKLNPILQFSSNDKYLIVTDNIAKYYLLDVKTGNLIWTKNNLAPFNSQVKIYKDMFFVIDFSNTLRCFSIKTGEELWNIKTENSLVRSQKKLSLVIVKDKIYFNNSIGDITAVDIKKGEMIWQLPTQSTELVEAAFSLENSDIVSDNKSLFFSNNQNQFFSIDIETGSFNWQNKVNSNIRPVVVGNIIFTVSLEGYLVVIDKISGNIIKVTDIFKTLKPKKRSKIKPTGFLIGFDKMYLSTSNGRIFIIDINLGKTISVLKIDNEKISRPFAMQNNLFVIKDNSVIRLN